MRDVREGNIGFLLKVITDKLRVRADADFKQYGLTFTQSRVMAFLNRKGGQATQKEIEVFLEVAHPTVVGVVSRMEQNGFVRTWFDPEDKRNKIVALTTIADTVGIHLDEAAQEQDQKLMTGLSEEEKAELERMLRIIYQNVEEGK